ncbi:MAG: hypothetical protein JXA03_14490 [Bacteroidales bacterium]|nr:hypothetical protein [Bacteroidales bacterium]
MKTTFNILTPVVSILILVSVFSGNVNGQTTLGVLPVNTSAVNSSVLDAQQWQALSLQLQDHLTMQLGSAGTVSKLTREHVLLALKGMPSPDPDNLSAEAIREIAKKEKLNYLVKCTFESIKVVDKNLVMPLIIYVADDSGKTFWERVLKIDQALPAGPVTEHILMEDFIKPPLEKALEEMKALNF